MSTILPTGSYYGSQVLTSGDLSVRSLSARNKCTVYKPDPGNPVAKTSHLVYVADPSTETITECSRVINESFGDAGYFSIGVLEPGTSDVVKTFKSDAVATTISAGGNSATVTHEGLSFDSDDCAIFFGKDKTFKIMFVEDAPARLVFQCLDPNNGHYVTKFSCLKSG